MSVFAEVQKYPGPLTSEINNVLYIIYGEKYITVFFLLTFKYYQYRYYIIERLVCDQRARNRVPTYRLPPQEPTGLLFELQRLLLAFFFV